MMIGATNAATVFTDNFEAPNVTAANSTGVTTGAITAAKWVKSTDGFGSSRQGTVDEAALAFTDPTGEQAYAFRYTNAGITSAHNTIGQLQLNSTITVSFDVVRDLDLSQGATTGTPYFMGLVTFNGASTRTSTNNGAISSSTTSILATTAGSATSNGAYTTISFSYVVGNIVVDNNGGTAGGGIAWDPALIGQDIALRFYGGTNSAIIDNVTVDITVIPEPTATLLGALGMLMLLRRRR